MLSDSWVTTSSLHWPVSLPGFILSSSEHVCCYCEPLLRALWQPSSPPAYANRTPQKTAPTRLHRALGSQPAEPWGRERGAGPSPRPMGPQIQLSRRGLRARGAGRAPPLGCRDTHESKTISVPWAGEDTNGTESSQAARGSESWSNPGVVSKHEGHRPSPPAGARTPAAAHQQQSWFPSLVPVLTLSPVLGRMKSK